MDKYDIRAEGEESVIPYCIVRRRNKRMNIVLDILGAHRNKDIASFLENVTNKELDMMQRAWQSLAEFTGRGLPQIDFVD